MILKSLHLENFGRHAVYDKEFADGFAITEELNGAGKTTRANAVSWVLTGKKLDGSTDIANYKPKHDTALKMVAEIVLVSGWDGNEPGKPERITLRKEFFENWKTTRGTDEMVMDGHTINYYVNTVPYKAQDYERELARLFAVPSYEWIAYLINPKYFAEILPMSDRLKKVVEAVGEPNLAEITTAEPITARIEKDLKALAFSADNLRKSLIANITAKKKTLMDTIAVVKSKVIDNPITDEQYIEAQTIITEAPTKEAHLIARKNGHNPKIAELQEALNTARQNDIAHTAHHNGKLADDIMAKQKATNEWHTKKQTAIQERQSAEMNLAVKKRLLDEKKADRLAKLATYNAVIASQFTAPSVCETCGRPFDETHVAKALADFNANRAATLSTIKAEGIELATAIKQLEADIPTLEATVSAAKNIIGSSEMEIRKLEAEQTTLKTQVLYSYESENTKAIRAQLESERGKPNGEDVTAETDALHEATKKANAVVQTYTANAKTVADKLALETAAKTLQTEIAELESKQTALVIYEKTWRDLMEKRARKVFGELTIRFTKPNLNGTYDRDCTFLNPKGITYESTNTAEKYQIGVAIIEAWREFHHIEQLPIIMDDFEHMDEDHQNFATKSQLLVFAVKRGATEREARA